MALRNEFGYTGVGQGRQSYRSMLTARRRTHEWEFEGQESGFVEIFEGFGSGFVIRNELSMYGWAASWSGSLCRLLWSVKGREDSFDETLRLLRDCLASGCLDLSNGWEAQLGALCSVFVRGGSYSMEFIPSATRALGERSGQPHPKYTVISHTFGQWYCKDSGIAAIDWVPGLSGGPYESYAGRPYNSRLVYFTQRMEAHVPKRVLFGDDYDSDDDEEEKKKPPIPPPVANLKRIEYYKAQIAQGARPIIWALGLHAGDRVILDGHHKVRLTLNA